MKKEIDDHMLIEFTQQLQSNCIEIQLLVLNQKKKKKIPYSSNYIENITLLTTCDLQRMHYFSLPCHHEGHGENLSIHVERQNELGSSCAKDMKPCIHISYKIYTFISFFFYSKFTLRKFKCIPRPLISRIAYN